MSVTDHVYTGGEHYFVEYFNGTHRVVRVDYTHDEPDVEFIGKYEECLKWLYDLVQANADYDLNL